MIKKLKKYFFFQCYSSILFRRQQENPRLEEKRVEECVRREKERERKRKIMRACTRERESVRKRFGSSFYIFFLHLGLPYANWAQPGVLFVLPEVFTLALRPSLTVLVFQPPSFWTPFPYSTYLTVNVTQVYVPRFFVSSQQRFGATDIKALGASQLSGLGQTVLQLLGKSVLQLHFIQKIEGERT